MAKSKFELVFEGKSIDVNLVINILKSNNIDSFQKSTTLGQLFPLYISNGWVKPIKVFVNKEDLKKAKQIIEDYFAD
jgi:hypothetical protein